MAEHPRKDVIVVEGGSTAKMKMGAIAAPSSAADPFGDLRGRVVYHEDILASTIDEWPET